MTKQHQEYTIWYNENFQKNFYEWETNYVENDHVQFNALKFNEWCKEQWEGMEARE